MEANKEVYLNQRINKAFSSGVYEGKVFSTFGLEYIDGNSFKLFAKPVEGRSPKLPEMSFGENENVSTEQNDLSYDKVIRVLIDGKVYEEPNDWTVDITTKGIDNENKTCGIVDGLGLVNNSYYFLWAFANAGNTEQDSLNIPEITIDNKPLVGFGLMRQPKGNYSAVSGGNKGGTATFTLTSPLPYLFTVGAKVLCWRSSSQYNTGVVQEILSDTQLMVKLDNISFYGTNLTSVGGVIVQRDYFKPWVAKRDGQTLYSNYYKLMSGAIFVDGVGTIYRFTHTQIDYGSSFICHSGQIQFNSTPFSAGITPIPFYGYMPPTSTMYQALLYSTRTTAIVCPITLTGGSTLRRNESEYIASSNLLFKFMYCSANANVKLTHIGFFERY